MESGLRPMSEADLPMVLAWRNMESVRRNMYTHHVIGPDEHLAWWRAQSVDPATRLLIFEMDGAPVGVVTFTRYTGPAGTASWAFYSGDPARRGVGKLMEVAALEYAFGELSVRRLECEVLSFNRAVVDFHLRFGFTVEGIARAAYERDGEFHDIYRLAMLATEWERFVKPWIASQAGISERTPRQTRVFALDLSPDAVAAFAAATGDRNPVHCDPGFAKAQGFPGCIAHGMLVGGELSRIFANEYPGPGTIYVSQSLQFSAPLFVGEPAEIELVVKSQIGRRLVIDAVARQNGIDCVSGTAVLLAPKGGPGAVNRETRK